MEHLKKLKEIFQHRNKEDPDDWELDEDWDLDEDWNLYDNWKLNGNSDEEEVLECADFLTDLTSGIGNGWDNTYRDYKITKETIKLENEFGCLDRNKVSKTGFIGYHYLFILLVFLVRKLNLVFLNGNLNEGTLLTNLEICYAVGIVLSWKYERNSISWMINTVSAFVLSFFEVVARSSKDMLKAGLIVMGIFTMVYLILFLFRRTKMRNERIRKSRYGPFTFLYGIRNACCIAVLGLLLLYRCNPSVYQALKPAYIKTPEEAAAILAKQEAEEEDKKKEEAEKDALRYLDFSEKPTQTIDKNIEVLSKLEENTWKTLSLEEKLEVCAVIADIETEALGLTFHLKVVAVEAKKGVEGMYDHSIHTIEIDLDTFELTGMEVCNTVLHEAFHAQERNMVEAFCLLDNQYLHLKSLEKFRKYMYDFFYPIEPDDDFVAYWEMDTEVDAREYAGVRTNEYFEAIEAYLHIKNPNVRGFRAIIRENGVYLVDSSGNVLAGPYTFIDVYSSGKYTFRYIGANGLIGYLDINGDKKKAKS